MDQFRIWPPCFINGVWTTDQKVLHEHYRREMTAQALGNENPFAEIEASGNVLTEHAEYLDKKRQREELEQSTEYGRLLKNNPAELQRIMKEDPDRYQQMTLLHTITMTVKK